MAKVIEAEWISHREAYRLYDPARPQQTIAYEDSEQEAELHARENGYSGVKFISRR